MPQPFSADSFEADSAELIIAPADTFVCETYIFEPTAGEERLGYLFAAAQAEDRDGIGSELVDTVVSAIQREYYRDQTRRAETSFEMALHQANLILHDTAEQGVRDWMGNFHMAVGVLAGRQLHISVAGGAGIFVARKSNLTQISEGLAHYPITNPLQTFSQVASGEVTARDTIFLSSGLLDELFQTKDVLRLTLERSATTISSRLKQLSEDQGLNTALSVVTVSLIPQYAPQPNRQSMVAPAADAQAKQQRSSALAQEQIRPRPPLLVRRSRWKKILLFVAQLAVSTVQLLRRSVLPAVAASSKRGGHALAQASRSVVGKSKGISIKKLPTPTISSLRSLPSAVKGRWQTLPSSSKIFGVICLVLLVSLGLSLTLLQRKRAADQEIQRASEILHEAQTKNDAAQTALIYDNREQAQGLLGEAQALANELSQSGFYLQETTKLQSDIKGQMDRLQRITRVDAVGGRQIGDFRTAIAGKNPQHLFLIEDQLYSYNPENNAIVKMSLDGQTEIVQQTSQNIGFLTDGRAHQADKTITFSTQPAGIALFDTKDQTLTKQELQLPSADSATIAGFDLFGNRLYAYSKEAKNIFSYNKTLRGYSSGVAWLEDDSVPKDTIVSLAVDGNIFTLHQDGVIRRLFKGSAADFTQDTITPSLAGATRLITAEDFQHLYVVDPANNRVVALDKNGALVQQVLLDTPEQLTDAAVVPGEDKIYLLAGTQVWEVSLAR